MTSTPHDFVARSAVIGLVVILAAAMALVAWTALPALLIIFCGVLIALLLDGMAAWIARGTGLGHRLSLTFAGLGSLAFIVGVLWFVGDGLATQLSGVSEALPAGVRRAASILRSWAAGFGIRVPHIADLDRERLFAGALGIVGSAVGVAGSAGFATLLGVFFAATPGVYRRGILYLVPPARRQRAAEVMSAVAGAVHRWLVSRLLIMAITLCTSYIGLALIGVPFAGGLAVLSALVVFVPYIGPYVSGGAAALVALLVSPETALYTVAFYLAVENLQGWTIEPMIESRFTSAPPGLLLSAQVILGVLLGAVGILLATPLAVAATVLVQMLYVQDVLGDDIRVLGERPEAKGGIVQGREEEPGSAEAENG